MIKGCYSNKTFYQVQQTVSSDICKKLASNNQTTYKVDCRQIASLLCTISRAVWCKAFF